jgi:hypothetical protein
VSGTKRPAEALCLTEDDDWEQIAARIGGTLHNREIGNTGEQETILEIPPAPAEAEPGWQSEWEHAGRDRDGNLELRHTKTGGVYRLLPVEDL